MVAKFISPLIFLILVIFCVEEGFVEVNNGLIDSLGSSPAILPTELFDYGGDIDVKGQDIQLSIHKRYDNPIIESIFTIQYGFIECDIMAAVGSGIISSFYLQADDKDEIDITEIFGTNRYEFQSNFFIKGNTSTWDRGGYHQAPDPLSNFNRYAVEWTSSYIKWYLNGNLQRHLDVSNPYGIPASPMRIKLSLWAGGDPDNSEGTVLWSGAKSDYQGMPYTMSVRNLHAKDYSTSKEYTFHGMNDWTVDSKHISEEDLSTLAIREHNEEHSDNLTCKCKHTDVTSSGSVVYRISRIAAMFVLEVGMVCMWF